MNPFKHLKGRRIFEVAHREFHLTQSDNAETWTEAHSHAPTEFRTFDPVARTIQYA
jgi:hypothetical protein